LAALFSGSVRNNPSISKDSKRAWITVNEVEGLVKNDTTFNLFLSLLYQQTRKSNIVFHVNKKDVLFSDLMNGQSDNLLLFESEVKEFVSIAHKVDTLLVTTEQKKKDHTPLTNDDYYNYISTSIDAIEYGLGIANLFDKDIVTGNFARVATTANDLYKNIYTQQYPQAITNAISILTDISGMVGDVNKNGLLTKIDSVLTVLKDSPIFTKKSFEDLKSKDLAAIDQLIQKYTKQQPALTSSLNEVKALYSFKEYDDIIAKIAKYALFMANVVNAKTPDEVASLIEGAVLPVGSSSIKKNSNFNISVQSYLGAFLLLQQSKANNGTWNDQFGVTAPIGVAFSWGAKKWGSFSLFASLFDLGAIVDYQLRQDSVPTSNTSTTPVVKKDYSVKLGQIFSPGGYFVYGFGGNIPLSFGIGAQYGPGLGKVDVSGATVINGPTWRWNAFLAVDIPFFTLKNNPKKYTPKK
jgi:hypothetical protein